MPSSLLATCLRSAQQLLCCSVNYLGVDQISLQVTVNRPAACAHLCQGVLPLLNGAYPSAWTDLHSALRGAEAVVCLQLNFSKNANMVVAQVQPHCPSVFPGAASSAAC